MRRPLLLLAAVVSLFCSCREADSNITRTSPNYSGQMTVLYDGEEFVQNDIAVAVAFNNKQSALDIELKRVKFAPAMPVKVDVTITDIAITKQGEGVWSFATDGVTPWALGGPYDKYRIDNLQGQLSENNISFTLTLFNTNKGIGYPTTYSGIIVQ